LQSVRARYWFAPANEAVADLSSCDAASRDTALEVIMRIDPGFPRCPFCTTPMDKLPAIYGLPEVDTVKLRTIPESGIPLAVFRCIGCGFVAGFDANIVIEQGRR
jgi:hypothetical protein